jgi:hyperosmotically inducible protein
MSTIDRRHVMLSLGLGLALLAGCEQKGPAQKAGEKVDKAVEDTGKAIKKAGKNAGEKLDEAAKKVRDATK